MTTTTSNFKPIMKLATLILLTLSLVNCYVDVKDFQKYGDAAGDTSLASTITNHADLDDGRSPEIGLTERFQFFNETYHSLYVNINGGVSFRSRIATYTPECASLNANMAMISPFWADVDLRSEVGRIYYRQTNDKTVLDKARADIVKAFPQDHLDTLALNWAFVATWENVPFYDAVVGCPASKTNLSNTFQMTLTTDGSHSFAVFYYNKIQWTTGTASQAVGCSGHGGHSARAGFDNGQGQLDLIPGSCSDDMLMVNTKSTQGEPGKYVFRIDGKISGNVTLATPPSTTPTHVETKPTGTNPPVTGSTVEVVTHDQEFLDKLADVRDDINRSTTLANELCPSLLEKPALQQQCFDQWILIDNRIIETNAAKTVDELNEILVQLDDVVDTLEDIKKSIIETTPQPPFVCPTSDSSLNRRCKETQRSLDTIYNLAKETCPLLIDFPALQKECFGYWVRVDNNLQSMRKVTAVDGFQVIDNDAIDLEKRLKKIRDDMGWH